MRPLARVPASSLTALALIVGACADGNGEGSSVASPRPPSSPAPESSADGDGSPGDDPVAASGSAAFQALVARARESTYTVTYVYIEPSGPGAQFTVAHGSTATAVVHPGGDLLIEGPAGSIMCDESSCTSVDQGFSLDLMVEGLLGPSAILADPEALGRVFRGVDLDVASETILGRSATCVTIDASRLADAAGMSLDGEVVSCADEETGVMLRTRYSGQNGLADLEATAFSTTADASLLTPPFEPQSPGDG